MLYFKQHHDKENGRPQQLNAEEIAILEKRIDEVAGAIVKEQFEYIRWYNTLDASNRSDIMLYSRASLLREAWMIMGNAQIGEIGPDSIAHELARCIHNECDLLTRSDATLLESTKLVDTKLQLITSMHKFLSEIAKSGELDRIIAKAIEHVPRFEDRKLKRYNVSRLNENQKQEILSILRLIATLGDMANRLGGKNESTKALVNNIYNSNVEKFASHVLN
jgi:hypothetical protein